MPRQQDQSFSTPSPGEILRRQEALRHAGTRRQAPAPGPHATSVPLAVFNDGHRVAANRERGVLMAPMIAEWRYPVADREALTKWLRMREILLSDARFDSAEATCGIHYFGTYIGQETTGDGPDRVHECRTLWGFSRREAMAHFFAIGKGEVRRKTIIETDLAEFLSGLKNFIHAGQPKRFRQTILVSPQVE